MRKAVLGIAAAATVLAAWFAPDDDGVVVTPAAATPREAPASALAAAEAPTAAPAVDLHIHARISDEELGDAFAKQSWGGQAAPSAPLKPAEARAAAPQADAASGPPPLPFQYLGRYSDDGNTAYFFQVDGQNVIARPGEKINDSYRLERVSDGTLHVLYLPLNQPQTLVVGDTN